MFGSKLKNLDVDMLVNYPEALIMGTACRQMSSNHIEHHHQLPQAPEYVQDSDSPKFRCLTPTAVSRVYAQCLTNTSMDYKQSIPSQQGSK